MTVEFRNSPIFFTVQGEGPALVLLHGFLEDGRIFDHLAAHLAHDFRIVVIDLPGHGRSATLGYLHTMDDMAEAVLAVLDHLAIDLCVMVGHSMGGYVTLAVAEHHPVRLHAIGLFHSTATADSEAKKVDRQRAIDLVMRSPEAFIAAAIPGLFAEASRPALHAEIQTLIARACEYPSQGIVANIRGMMQRPDRTHVLGSIAMPVLILHGEEDAVIPTDSISLQATLPADCSFLPIKGIGHMGYLEAPELCLSAIHGFVEQVFEHGRATAHS